MLKLEKNANGTAHKVSGNAFPEKKKEKNRRKKNILHHSHAVNWFSAVNLRSLFGQAISKMREHEMISQHIYLDKSRGC